MRAPYATEYIFYRPLVTTGAIDYQTNPTIASGDFQVSTDGSAWTNLDTLPTLSPAADNQVKITVSVAEMTGKQVSVRAVDAAGDEWEDDWWIIETEGNASAQFPNSGEAMRGTDSAALASVATEARLAELDAANLPTDIADIPTVAEFEARTIAAADYFDPANDAVANVTLCATTTTNTDMVSAFPTGEIWVDGSNGNDSNAGTPDSPVLTFDEGITKAAAAGLTRLRLTSSALVTFTPTAAFDGYEITGSDPTSQRVDLNGQSADRTTFNKVGIVGDCSAADVLRLYNCDLTANVTGLNCRAFQCKLFSPVTIRSTCFFDDCTAAASCALDFNTTTAALAYMRNWSGDITIQNAGSASDRLVLDGHSGAVTVAATVSEGTSHSVAGGMSLTDSSTGNAVVTDNTDTSAIWDATQADYVTAGTTGKSLDDAGGGSVTATVWEIVFT